MLAHRICQCTARTPSLHPVSRVLCRRAAPRRFKHRPFHHIPSRYNNDLKNPEQTQFSEPILNWTPRTGSDEGSESIRDRELRIELLKRELRYLRGHKIVEPTLNWISGAGPSNLSQGIKSQEINIPYIEDPKLSWLSPSRNSLRPQLHWEQPTRKRTGRDLKKLLIDAAFDRVRRRRSRLREPKRSLITRYLCFRKAPGLTRKVKSGIRNASTLQVLEEPSIRIGEVPVLGDKSNPRPPRQHRLEFNPFTSPETPRTETIQDFLCPRIKEPESCPASPKPLLRRVTSKKKDLNTPHAQRSRKSEARKQLLDAQTSAQPPTKPLYRWLCVDSPSQASTGNIRNTHTSIKTQQNILSLRSEDKNPETLKLLVIDNAGLFRRVTSVGPDRKVFGSRVDIKKNPNIRFYTKLKPHNVGKMDESSANSGKATDIIIEAVPNNTNVEVPPSVQDGSNPNPDMTAEVMQEAVSNTSIETPALNEKAAPKPSIKRVYASPARVTGRQPNKKQRVDRKKLKPLKPGSSEEILQHDIQTLLSNLNLTKEDIEATIERLPEPFSNTVELTITELSSLGDGLAVHDSRVYVVPFTLPGDKVEVKIRHHEDTHTIAELIKVLVPSSDRDDSLIGCKYFATCSGCQLQMLSYEKQLEHKRRVVQKAFASFSNLPAELLPEVLDAIGSPRQYQYRTKLTPHFHGPRKGGFKPGYPTPNIGFMVKGGRYIVDIEDCPIGTETLSEGMKSQRAWVKENLQTFKRGATLLLRESTDRVPIDGTKEGAMEADGEGGKYVETKKCITNSNERSVEYIGDFRFDSPAGSFFQNNNSILPSFTDYVRENLHFPVIKKAADASTIIETTAPKYLVDAYCGSGLFSVACGQGLERVVGIDVDQKSIASARKNAELNNIKNATFIHGNAEAIFASIEFPGSETSLIIDPPRKGCDEAFLSQLLDFQPKRVVYVSCNVHTQAKDIGYILRDERGKRYKVDSIRGFDFFPQTHHVEGVVVMTRVD